MGMSHELPEPNLVLRRPSAGLSLAAAFYNIPGIVPPAPVVVGGLWNHNLGRRHRILACGTNRAKRQQSFAQRNDVIEVSLLAVGLTCQNQQRSDRHRHHLANVDRTLSAANPSLVLLEKFPYRSMMG